jgi:hypothetical protein
MKTKINFSIKLISYSLFLLTIFSCEKKLSNPEIFKGVKLGMKYENATDTLLKNGGCESDINPENMCKYSINLIALNITPLNYVGNSGICQFKITSDIYACPQLFKAKYDKNDIVCYAILLFHSPVEFEELTFNLGKDLNGFKRLGIYQGMPAVNKSQKEEIISMFDKKYGVRSVNCESGNYCWEKDDLIIELYCDKYVDRDEPVFEDAFKVFALYRYNKEMNKLIEYSEKSKNGNVIGDNI